MTDHKYLMDDYDLQIVFKLRARRGTGAVARGLGLRAEYPGADVGPMVADEDEAVWSVVSQASGRHAYSEEHWLSLAGLAGEIENIRDIAVPGSARLTILIDVSDHRPGIGIPPAMAAFAAALDAEIDVEPQGR